MMSTSSKIIYNLTSKNSPSLKLWINIKNNFTDSVAFYYLITFFKILGLLIITDNFITKTNDLKFQKFKISFHLKRITCFNIFAQISFNSYFLISVILFIILVIFTFMYIYLYTKIKEENNYLNKDSAKIIIRYFSILSTIIMIMSQHMLEFFSFIYLIYFNNSNTNDIGNGISNKAILFLNLTSNTNGKIYGIILLVINLISIVHLNLFNYIMFNILNEPFFSSTFPINFRYSSISILYFLFLSNLQAIHYIDIFIASPSSDGTFLMNYKISIFIIINFFTFYKFIKTYRKFNFNHNLSKFIYFMITYSFFSSLLEVIMSISVSPGNDISERTPIKFLFIYICKLFFCLCFMNINNSIYYKLYLIEIQKILFKKFNDKISNSEIEGYYKFINILIDFKNKKIRDQSKIIDIILLHKEKCGFDNCKCSVFNNLTNINILDEINSILDSVFSNIDLSRDEKINFLFSEYLCEIKNSTLFSYAILNTFMIKNIFSKSNNNKYFNSFKTFHLYELTLFKVDKFRKEFCDRNFIQYSDFISIYSEVERNKIYTKKIKKFIQNFESILSVKESFNNSIKVRLNGVDDEEEVLLDSNFSSLSLKNLIIFSKNLEEMYKELKNSINIDFAKLELSSYELSYKLFLFFFIFNKKIPKKIANLLKIEQFENSSNVSEHFNKVFNKYFSHPETPLNIIIEVNSGFKIKYISHKLSQILGHNYSKIINEDLHSIFPSHLREQHKMVLLSHFLIKKQTYFEKKTFAFTSTNNIIPVQIKVSVFPNLKKTLHAIVSLKKLEVYGEDKSKYYFVLSDKFELIALSKNLEEKYSINYDLIEKFNIELLKIFNMTGLLQKNFRNEIDKLKILKQEKMKESLYSLSNYVFNLNFIDQHSFAMKINNGFEIGRQGNANYNVNSKLKESLKLSTANIINSVVKKISLTDDYLISNNNNQNDSSFIQLNDSATNVPGNSLMKFQNLRKQTIGLFLGQNTSVFMEEEPVIEDDIIRQNDRQFIITREKKTIIRNLEKIQNRSYEMDVNLIYFNKIAETIKLMKGNKNNYDRKSNKRVRSFYDENELFKIKVDFRQINDVPFYIIEFSEMFHEIRNINVKDKKKTYIKNDVIREATNDDGTIEYQSYSDRVNKIFKRAKNLVKFMNIFKSANQIRKNKLFNPVADVLLKSGLTKFDARYEKLIVKNRKLVRQISFMIGLISFLLITLTLSIVIYLSKKELLKDMKQLYSMNYWNHCQNASFTYLYSSLLSFILKLDQSTSFSSKELNLDIDLDEIKNLISYRVTQYRTNFNNNIQNYNNLDYAIKALSDELYLPKIYNKVELTWKNIQINVVITNVMDYVCTNLKFLFEEKDFSNLIYDIDNLIINRRYLSQEFQDKPFKSDHSKVIYFLNENYLLVEKSYQNINQIVSKDKELYESLWVVVSIILEIIEIIVSIFILVIILYFINLKGRIAFKTILEMFLNLRNGRNKRYNPNLEAKEIKNKIKNYKNLLKNFNLITIKAIHNKTIETSNLLDDYSSTTNLPKIENCNSDQQSKNDTKISFFSVNSNNHLNTIKMKHQKINNEISLNNSSMDVSVNHLNKGTSYNNLNLDLKKISPLNLQKETKKTSSNNYLKSSKINFPPVKDEPASNKASSFLTNEKIYKNLKLRQLHFIKILKRFVIIIFLIFVIFLIANIFANLIYFLRLVENYNNSNNLIVVMSVYSNLYNSLRLMIIENNLRHLNYIDTKIKNFTVIEEEFDKLLINYPDNSKLTNFMDFALKTNLDNELSEKSKIDRGKLICGNNTICSAVMKSRINSKGIILSLKSSVQILNNIYKDFTVKSNEKLTPDSQSYAKENMKKYFFDQDFILLNLQSEFVFSYLNEIYLDLIQQDMDNIFDFFRSSICFLAFLPIVFNVSIIIILNTGFYLLLIKSFSFINYTAKKFNRILFDN